jgi:biopolymer transport protein ExbB/TolQ
VSTLAATDGLAEALARIASSLRIPVLILALLVLLVCAIEVGRYAVELWYRMRAGRSALRNLAHRVVANPKQAAGLSARAPSSFARDALVEIARAVLAGEQAGIEYALADYELAVQRRLDHTRVLVRAGPALGLMGTLIPLAPGLAALGHGEVNTLATDLRTAFAATTVGLLVGTVAFTLTLTRTRMYTEDLTALERATDSMGTHAPQPTGAPHPPAHAPTPVSGSAVSADRGQVQAAGPPPPRRIITSPVSTETPFPPPPPQPPEVGK